MFIFTEGQGRPEIHESARGRLHAEKNLRAVRLVFALAPLMRVRGKSHGKFECLVNLGFSVAPYEAIKRAPQELRGFPCACFPIGWIRDSEFNQNPSRPARLRSRTIHAGPWKESRKVRRPRQSRILRGSVRSHGESEI